MTSVEMVAPEVYDPIPSAVAGSCADANQSGRRRRVAVSKCQAMDWRSLTSGSRSALLEQAYEEFYRCLAQGEQPDIEDYCARFPTFRTELRRTLEFAGFLGQNPTFLEDDLPWPAVGEQCGDLTLLRPLGCGRRARVFLAAEASTGGRLVAVKFSVRGDAEARTLGRLSHPHIVPILSARVEESTGLTMVCMPYLGSATLEHVLQRISPMSDALRPRKATVLLDAIRACAQPEDPPAAPVHPRLQKGSYTDGVIHLAVQLAEALAFLHKSHVCHRDLKPSNVLLDPSGKPLLLDFNLSASELETAVPNGGTLGYMAPEQIHVFLKEPKGGVDERADLFAFGVLVYQLLSGRYPYGPIPSDPNPQVGARLLLKSLQSDFQPFRRVCPELERPVAAVLDRCLAVEAADRPQSATELVAELKRQFAPARRLRRRIAARRRTTLAALGLLLLSAVAAGQAWSGLPPYGEREYQQGEADYWAGNYEEAEKHFDRAAQTEPTNPRFRFARGCTRLKQSKYLPINNPKQDLAWEDLKPAQGPPHPRILAVKAYIEGRKQNARTAIRMYNQILEDGYRPVSVLNNRAYCYIQMNHFQEARSDLDKGAQLDPNCQAVFYNRATLALHKRLNDPKSLIPASALDDIERAIRLGPATPALHRDAALLYAQAADDGLRRVPVSFDAPIVPALYSQACQKQAELAISHLGQAITKGEPSTVLTKHYIFRRMLLSYPAFAELRRMPSSQPLVTMELRLLDPIDLPN